MSFSPFRLLAFAVALLSILSISYAANAEYTIRSQVNYQNGTPVVNASFILDNFSQSGFTRITSNASNASGFATLTFVSEAGGAGRAPDILRLSVYVTNSTDLNNVTNMMPPIMSPGVGLEAMFNRSNVTTYAAATIFINATNQSGVATNISGLLLDTKTDMPIDMFISPHATTMTDAQINRTIVVMRDRNYTLVAMHHGNPTPTQWDFGKAPQSISITSGNLTNNLRPVGTSGGYIVDVNFSETKYIINVSLSICGAPSSVTYQSVWLYPVAARRVPLFAGIMGDVGNSPRLNTQPMENGTIPFTYNLSQTAASAHTGTVNISVSGRPEGLNYLLAVFAYNGTAENSAATYYGGFQNITITNANTSLSFQLCNLTGNFTRGSSVSGGPSSHANTSRFVLYINDTDSQGQSAQGDAIQVTVNLTNGSGNGAVDIVYLAPQNSSGNVIFPVHRNTDIEVKFLGGKYAPRKYLFNSSVGGGTVQMASFRPQNSLGVVRSNTQIWFLTHNATCNVPEPPAGCLMRQLSGNNFRPTDFNQKGALVNVRLLDPSGSGTIFYFVGVDMFASGPPDFMADNTVDRSAAGTATRSARLGSSVPGIFDVAYVGIPYDDAFVDETQDIRLLGLNLFDENWNTLWAGSGDANGSTVPTRFSDYPNATLLFNTTVGGLLCSKTDTNATSSCFASTTTNYIWLRVPHFSGSEMQVRGTAISLASVADEYEQRELNLGAELLCPGNQLEVTAISKAAAVEDVTIKLTDSRTGVKVGEEQTTDAEGKTAYTISKAGSYKVINSVQKRGYTKAGSITVDVVLCSEEAVAPPPPLPPPPAAEEEEPAPAPSAAPSAAPGPSPTPAPAPAPSATPAPAPTPSPAPSPTPSASPAPAPAAAPVGGLDLGMIAGIVVVILVVAGALYFFVLAAPKK